MKSIFQIIPDISILEEKKPIHETFFVYWQWWVFPVYDYNLCNMISQLKKCQNLIYCMSISKKFFFQQSHTHVQTPSSNGLAPMGQLGAPMGQCVASMGNHWLLVTRDSNGPNRSFVGLAKGSNGPNRGSNRQLRANGPCGGSNKPNGFQWTKQGLQWGKQVLQWAKQWL